MPDWWESTMFNSDSDIRIQIEPRPCIEKVPNRLRRTHQNAELFEPQVVSIGPYHYSNPKLKPMEEFKKASTKWFMGDVDHKCVYLELQKVANAKEYYVEISDNLKLDEFINMMVFDGCFLLQFIDNFGKDKMADDLSLIKHLRWSIMKDIFLLENQIPYFVLTTLMKVSKKSVDIIRFMQVYIGYMDNIEKKDIEPPNEPIHLLGLLQRILAGKTLKPPPVLKGHWKTSHSVSQLVNYGIKFEKSKRNHFSDIHFKGSEFLKEKITLPVIIINNLMLSRFLNLIAFEMSPNNISDYRISSYIWLMNQLIQQKEDVKELVSNGILLNELGTDQQVCDLFHELAREMEPDRNLYFEIMHGIDIHCSNKIRVWILQPVAVHFSQWGTNPIAFAAAALALVLTFMQTIYATKPPNSK